MFRKLPCVLGGRVWAFRGPPEPEGAILNLKPEALKQINIPTVPKIPKCSLKPFFGGLGFRV